MSYKIFTLLLLLAVVKHTTGVKCYHCYDLYKGTGTIFANSTFGDKLVKCDRKQKDWNSWDCPPGWPVCVIMSTTSKTYHEVLRTCAVKDFCSLYAAPEGVTLETCRECDTTLCNDYTGFPNGDSGPSFAFNINLVVNKYTLKYDDKDE